MVLLLAMLLAAPAGHRARAVEAEALGHMQTAAREYEAAWQEERAPDLLYRLGIVQRKLKRYGLAREALRAYLREAPEGGLRDEVLRQLAKLEVLIEAQTEDYTDAPRKRLPAKPAPLPAKEAPQPPAATSRSPTTNATTNATTTANATIPRSDPVSDSSSATGPASIATQQVATPSPISAQLNPALSTAAAESPDRSLALSLSPSAIPPAAPPPSRLAPYLLAGGAAIAASAGAYLWWDGARLANSLDARYASGDLTAADRDSYSRAHTVSLAGRLLVVAAAGLAAGAVWAW